MTKKTTSALLCGLGAIVLSACGPVSGTSPSPTSPEAPSTSEVQEEELESFTEALSLKGTYETRCLKADATPAVAHQTLISSANPLYRRERITFFPDGESHGRHYRWIETFSSKDCTSESLIVLEDLQGSYRIEKGGLLKQSFASQNISFHQADEAARASTSKFCDTRAWRIHAPLAVENTACDRNHKSESEAARASLSPKNNLRIDTCKIDSAESRCSSSIYLHVEESARI